MGCKITHNHHVYFHTDAAETAKLDQILALLKTVSAKENQILPALDDLKAKVAQNTTVTQSAVVLINGIAQRIIDAGTDPVALQALSDSLTADDAALAAAVAANTVAAATP